MRYSQFWPLAARDWDAMKIEGHGNISTSMATQIFTAEAKYAIQNKDRYLEIQEASKQFGGDGVPWPFLAAIHRREGDGNFGTYLGNGQTLVRRTTLVPAGRGPFFGNHAFLNGALDALKIDQLVYVKDWRLEKMLYYGIGFNGWGYGIDSPYCWGLTDIEHEGKYVADHVYSSHIWDTQPGIAPLIQMIGKLDNTVTFTRES